MFHRPKALPQFTSQRACAKEECVRPAEKGSIEQAKQTFCSTMFPNSSTMMDEITDLAKTLANVMVLCDIHECKARASWEVIVDHFVNCDIDANTPDRKCLRKEQLYRDLFSKALVERHEIDFMYYLIKCGFKAIYHKPQMNLPRDPQELPYNDECVWLYAAKKTAQKYALENHLVCEEKHILCCKICNEYKQFYERMCYRKQQAQKLYECNCCYCAKKRAQIEMTKEPKCMKEKKKPCPKCCKKVPKKKIIKPKFIFPMCTKCNRLRNFCECKRKHHFNLDWVKSIWLRPDFETYYNSNIAEPDFPMTGIECQNSETGSLDKLKREERIARQAERAAAEAETEGLEGEQTLDDAAVALEEPVEIQQDAEDGGEPKMEENENKAEEVKEETPAEEIPAEG